jgi:glycosyltransferase involved in cell wall biosynthesis
MRIIILAKRTVSHGFGGMETHTKILAQVAAGLEHEVTVLTTAHPKGLKEEIRDGYRVEFLPGTTPGRYSRAWWRASSRAVEKMGLHGAGDLILSLSLAGYGVATSAIEAPHYTFVSGKTLDHLVSEWKNWADFKELFAYPKHAVALCYLALLERRLWGRVDGLIAKDDVLYQDLLERGRRVLLFYNGTDTHRFKPDPSLREATRHIMGIEPQSKVLLMVATVNPQKGVWVGVDAFLLLARHWPSLRLVVVGDGPDRTRLEVSLKESPFAHRVHWIGAVKHPETAGYFAAADLFLYPTFRIEGLPNAIVEAMSTGLPVVATDRGGVRSAVKHGETGILLTASSADAVADAIGHLLPNSAKMSSMSKKARETALAHFDVRTQVARLLQNLCGRRVISDEAN